MYTTLFFLSLFLALIHAVLAQSNFTIDSPNFVQCQSTLLTWADTGHAPYDLLVVPAQDPCGEALEDLGNFTCNAVTWTVSLASGTEVVLSIVDAVGDVAWSGTITVGNSNDTSCLNTTVTPASDVSSGQLLSVPPSGGYAASPTSSPLPSSSAFAPAGAANAGLGSASGALLMRPISIFTLFSCAVLAIVAFAF